MGNLKHTGQPLVSEIKNPNLFHKWPRFHFPVCVLRTNAGAGIVIACRPCPSMCFFQMQPSSHSIQSLSALALRVDILPHLLHLILLNTSKLYSGWPMTFAPTPALGSTSNTACFMHGPFTDNLWKVQVCDFNDFASYLWLQQERHSR